MSVMPTYQYPELHGRTPTDQGDPLRNIVNAGRSALCTIYREAPYVLGYPAGTIDPTGFGRAVRGTLDRICADGPLPAPPSLPFPGGQCQGTDYLVSVGWVGATGQTGFNQTIRPGPIGPPRTGRISPSGISLFFTQGGPPASQVVQLSTAPDSAPEQRENLAITSFTVTPVAGGPDNCGNPSETYPPRSLPPEDYSPTVPTRRGDDIAPLPVEIFPVDFDVNVDIDLNPTFVVNVDGLDIIFDWDGAVVLAPKLEIPITIGGGPNSGTGNPKTPKKSPKPLSGEAIADRFDRIEDLLGELEECACPSDLLGPFDTIPGNVLQSQCVSLSPERVKYVALRITSAPANRKEQNGGNAPDVLYCGWAWFRAGEDLLERMPVDALGKMYKAPKGATAFCYTVYSGYQAQPFLLNKPLGG